MTAADAMPAGGAGRTRRRLWRGLHLWLGVTAGVVLALIGLTGSVNVFYRELDALLEPGLYRPRDGAVRIGPSQALAAAAAVDPAPVTMITPPDPVWPVWIVTHEHPGQRLWTTMVDPSDGAVLGRRDTTTALVYVVYRLHYTLLLRAWWGKEIVGILGGVLLVSLGSGLVLWWPRPGLFWRSVSLRRAASPQRRWIDLHVCFGFWSCGLMLAIVTFGLGLVFPDVARPLIGLVSPATAPPSPVVPARTDEPLAADAILAAARAAQPGARITRMNPPTARRNTWRILLVSEGANSAVRMDGALWIDPWSGAIVRDRTWGAMSGGDRYQTVQLWLHNGAMAGLPGRLLVAFAGFVPAALCLSGWMMWSRRRSRPVRARRTDPDADRFRQV